jgi:iron complex outermembrane receptor protein
MFENYLFETESGISCHSHTGSVFKFLQNHKHMKNAITLLIIILSPVFLKGTNPPPDTLNIEEILVVGKTGSSNIKTPLTGKNIHLTNPHDGGEIFKYTPGFNILKKGNYAMEPVLRGYKFEQLNVQMDGGIHSTNACPNRMDPAISQISIEDIEKVEVIKGPYSVRFGPVFGGIVNVIDKRPQRKGEQIVSGTVEGGYQSNGNNFYTNLYSQIVKDRWDFLISAGYKDYGDYTDGNGDTIASSFRRFGYSAKAGYNISSNQRLQIGLRQSFARDVLYPGLPMDAIEDNSTIVSSDYAATNLSEKILSLKIKGYASFIDHLMTNEYRPNYALTHSSTPVTAENYGGRTELGIKPGKNDVLFAGIDYQYIGKDGVRHREVYKNGCTTPPTVFDPPKNFTDKVWQDSHKSDFGIFAENKWQLSEKLLWQAGVRIDFVSFDIKDPENDFYELYKGDIKPGSKISPAVNSVLTWDIGNSFRIQWAVASAQRTPDLTELFINHLSVGLDAYEYVGNPKLNPETNYQTDIKIEKAGEFFSFYADWFYSYLTDYISAVVDTTIPRKFMPCKEPKFTKRFVNIDKAYMTGFEAGIDVKFLNNFKFNLGAAYTYAQNITLDEPLPEIPPLTLNTGLKYSASKFNAQLNARIASEQDRISSSFNESTTPGFSVFDFYFSYKPLKFLEINAAVTNIFDKNYVEHLSRPYKNMDISSLYYEPGRSFNVGLKFIF